MKKAKGIAMATSLWVVVLVAVFAFALMTLSNISSFYSRRGIHEVMAFEAAQAGIADAMYNLAENQSWTAGFNNKTVPNGSATYSVTFNTAAPNYSVNNINGASAASGFFGANTVAAKTAQVICTGTSYIADGQPVRRTLFASVKVNTSSAWGVFAAFGFETVNVAVNNCSIDGFSSASGPYAPPDPPGHYNSGGDIGTNSWVSSGGSYVVDSGNVTAFTSQAEVYGDVYTGVGTTQASVSGTMGTNYNAWQPLPAEVPLTPVTIPSAPAGTIVGSTYYPGTYATLPSSNITLTSGTYVITGNVRITGNRTYTLNIINNEPVKIYFNGTTWDTGGCSFENTTNRARNLQIFCGQNCTSMDIKGSSGGYYAVYAPYSAINIHSSAISAIYGSVIGKTVSASSGQAYIHHDMDLSDVGPASGPGRTQLLGWQEL